MSFDTNHILLPIVLLPIIGALYNGIMGRRVDKSVVTTVAVGSVFGSFLLALVGFGFLLRSDDPRLVHDVYEWFTITVGNTEVPIRVRFVMDHLSGIMTVMVTGIGALIHVYSIGYMEEDEGYARFMTYLNLFMASMLILVLASNFPLLFVGWEGVGLCSYLLIGFWYKNESYAQAGKKAFVVNRIGDFGVLIGMFILASSVSDRSADAFEFEVINSYSSSLGLTEFQWASGGSGFMVATIAGLFIFLGCTGKSAQIPLFVWLPDAMAGPTPVSALIHAATMVTAGVYLCCRLSPVLVESTTCMAVIAITGALTALLAASIALVQNEMKKILAYSTVSQLGFMFSAVGMGAFAGGFFHVFTHAFFKACLFLGAGSVMHAIHAHGDADIRYLGGLRKKMPATHVTFAIATAAIAGLPFLSGFFSKDEILLGALTWGSTAPARWNGDIGFFDNLTAGNWAGGWVGWFVFGVLTLAAFMTAFYMFRLYFRTFWGEYKGGHAPGGHGDDAHGDDAHAEEGHGHDDHWVEPHESPDTMTVPLYVLAFGAAVVGLLGLPHLIPVHGINWWSGWLTPQHEEFVHVLHERTHEGVEHEAALREAANAARQVSSSVATLRFDGTMVHAPSWVPIVAMVVGLLVALGGFGLAFVWYKNGVAKAPERLMQSAPWLHRFLMDKWRVDGLYDRTIVSLMKWLGVVSANLDKFLVDMVLTRLTAWAMQGVGFVVTRAQSGVIYAYAALFIFGMAGLTWWFTYPHPMPEGEESRVGHVRWEASAGLDQEVRWDFDSDGVWDTEWGSEVEVEHDYANHQSEDGAGAQIDAMVGIFETRADNFGPQEIVVGPGESTELSIPGVIPEGMWVDPAKVPSQDEGWARFWFDLFGAQPPTLSMRTVMRFDGQLPDSYEIADDGRGNRTATVTFSIHPLPTEDAPNPDAAWGPVEREVSVAPDGTFAVLLGAEEELAPSDLPIARVERDGGESSIEMRGVVHFAGESSEVAFDPRVAMVVHIHDALIRDDDIRDGILALEPGQTIQIANDPQFRLTVAVQVRATVEARNAFGNVTRSSEEVTMRVARAAEARAAAPAGVTR